MNLPFQKVFYISLRNSTTRRNALRKQFMELDLKDNSGNQPEWITGEYATFKGLQTVHFDPNRKAKLTETEIGCYASHYKIFLLMVFYNVESALILEDDAKFHPDFLDRVQDLPKDWEYLSFGHGSFGNRKNYVANSTENKRLVKGGGYWFTHAYAITLQTAKFFVERLRIQTDSIDCQIADLQHEINSYAFVPSIIDQDGKHQSTIIHTSNARKK